MSNEYIDVIFDGPPSHVTGRFVEVENAHGASINAGDWIENDNGTWTLRIRPRVFQSVLPKPEANPHLKKAEEAYSPKNAAVQATLALAYEQRTANLIASAHLVVVLDGPTVDISKELYEIDTRLGRNS